MNRTFHLLRGVRLALVKPMDVSLFNGASLPVVAIPKNSLSISLMRNMTSKPEQSQDTNSKEEKPSEIKSEEDAGIEAKLNEEVEKLKEELATMKDKYQRSIAENENVRKRLRKEISDAKVYGIQSFCKDLLEVADILDKAVHSVPEEILLPKDHADHDHWKNFYDGVYLTKNQLLKVFQRHGLEPLEPKIGEKFDPNFHEAIFQAAFPDLEPGVVAHINSIGYVLNERTLRPAQVGVSKAN